MPDNKNNNNGRPLNEGVSGNENRDYLIHSLQTDNSNYVPPPVSKLSGNVSDTNDKNKDD